MSRQPLLTIGIPLFNAAPYIKACLSSAIEQANGEVEILIVDDGSSDDSFSIASTFQSENEPLVRLLKSETNQGPLATRKRIIDLAKGKYLAWLDGDDELSKSSVNAILQTVKNAKKNNTVFLFNARIVNSRTGESSLLYRHRPTTLTGIEAAKDMIFGKTYKSYPWTIVSPVGIARQIAIPPEETAFIDDQLIGYQYPYFSEQVIYIDTPIVIHTLRPSTDSHSPLFFHKLANTFSYQAGHLPSPLCFAKKGLRALAILYEAIFSAQSRESASRKFRIKALSKELKSIKLDRTSKIIMPQKAKIQLGILRHAPGIFLSYYGQKKRF